MVHASSLKGARPAPQDRRGGGRVGGGGGAPGTPWAINPQ